jgi:23S rRNA (adenine2503-C2)-methyltransferase
MDAAAPTGESRAPLFGLDAQALATVLAQEGEPGWRAKQIAEAMYCQYITDISSITTLSLDLRRKLASKGWQIGRPLIAKAFQSYDGTERYLVQCQPLRSAPFEVPAIPGGPATVETVWMPEGDDGEAGDGSDQEPSVAPSFPARSAGRVGSKAGLLNQGRDNPEMKPWRRATICVSSQVGCAVNCQFCLTAKLGLQRNLTRGEICGQVISVLARHDVRVGRDRVNLVFMGMGEPFLNYDNFMAAVRLLVHEVGLSPQRMTVSTSGIVPGILRFANEPPDVRPKLAISLNAPNDKIRAEIMPINRKWPIAEVIDAVSGITLRPRERITFEYVLLSGVTDRQEHASELARLVRRTGLPAKVNLIVWNPGPGIAYEMPDTESVESFKRTLAGEGIPVYLRQPRGRDIFAACGQLKRTVESPK